MKHFAAVLALSVTLIASAPAQAGDNWDLYKEAWEYKPWAIIIAAPAIIVTAPFMLGFLFWFGLFCFDFLLFFFLGPSLASF